MGNNLMRLDRDQIVKQVIETPSLQTQIIDLNQAQLYEHGVDSKGDSTGGYASATIYGTNNFKGKIQKGQRYDHVTLKDSGASYASMRLVIDRGVFKIAGDFPDSVDEQWPDAMGLTDESKAEIMPEIKERTIDLIRQKILR